MSHLSLIEVKKILHTTAIIGIIAMLQGAGTPSALKKAMDALDADTVLRHGSWSLTVLTADSGKVIASKNAQLGMIPASTLKILTAGAALGLLGTDFRYETKIEYDGTWDSISGIIHGNIFIKGSGDPTLMSKYFPADDTIVEFENLPARFAAMGIRKIDGDIIGDASCFSDNPAPDDWTWSDLGQYYGAGVCGLAYRDNAVKLYFNSANNDTCPITGVFPQPEGVVYESFVIADGKKDEAFVYGAPYGNMFYVYGNIPAGKKNYEVEAADPDPAYQCAVDIFNAFKRQGIQLGGRATTVRRMQLEDHRIETKRQTLTFYRSHELSEIVSAMNINSDNVYAEQLLRTLGMLKGNGGTEEAGIGVVKNYWKSLGVDVDGLYMTDGSGLSRSNTITTDVQAKILAAICKQKWFNDFYNSLPVAGESGSMTNLCKGTFAEHNMHAKTGYINRARGYAGYVKTKSGKMLCFSLLADNYSCSAAEMKKRLEKILVALAEAD